MPRLQGLKTRTEGKVTFVALPRELWREAGACRCGYCDGTAYWDTLAVPHDGGTTWTCHHPEVHGEKFKGRR